MERFNQNARRVIFFARYEASHSGSWYIETDHLLLGLLRGDKQLANRFLGSHAAVDSVRKQIEGRTVTRESISTSVGLPLSYEAKRVLAYASEEAGRDHRRVGSEHLLLGLMREEKCSAAALLRGRGLSLSSIRDELGTSPPSVRGIHRPVSAFKLTALQPKLNKADPSNLPGFHEGPGPHEKDPRIANPWASRLVTCQNMTMARFAESLPEIAPGYIHRASVEDSTRLDGAWDFTLSFSPAHLVHAMEWGAYISKAGSPPVTGPIGAVSLFEALETQLGLKLEPIKP